MVRKDLGYKYEVYITELLDFVTFEQALQFSYLKSKYYNDINQSAVFTDSIYITDTDLSHYKFIRVEFNSGMSLVIMPNGTIINETFIEIFGNGVNDIQILEKLLDRCKAEKLLE